MACLCSYIDSTWLHLVQFWWNDKRIIVITGEKKIFSFIAWMKWNEINFCLQWMILSTQTSSIPFITCSLCWKIKYSISLYIWAPFKTSQNVYFDIHFPLLSQGFWILYTTLLFLQFFFLQKLRVTVYAETLLYIGNFMLNSFVIIYVRKSVNIKLTFVPVSLWIFMKSFPHPW